MRSRIDGRIWSWVNRHFIGVTVTGLFLLFIFIHFAERIFITIPAGHGGALWLRFLGGSVVNFHYGEGMKIIPPWDKIYIYDLRVQQETQKFDVLTNEGLAISVDATLRFRLNPRALGAITAYAGPNFVNTLVMPTVGATLRLEAAKDTAEEIYSTRRHELEKDILGVLSTAIDELLQRTAKQDKPEIIVEDFWFRSITLPPALRDAIEAKLAQHQVAEQYIYILQREERERQRKIVEAEGIKAFQDIVSSGISENYLRWKGIDATLKLAESNNSKIVIIGGKDGMPIILGPLDSSLGGTGQLAPTGSGGAAAPAPSGRSGTAATPSEQSGGTTASEPSASVGSYLRALGLPPEPLALDPSISAPVAPSTGPLPSHR